MVETEILVGHPSGNTLGATVCRKLELISSHKYWYGCPQHTEDHRNMRVEEIVWKKEEEKKKKREKEEEGESPGMNLEGTNFKGWAGKEGPSSKWPER